MKNRTSYRRLFRRLCLVATVVALCVIVLGAWVRLSHAGLGCPDWPGCYGHLTVQQALENAEHASAAFPGRPLEADKALKEMIHRYLATILGLIILAIAAVAWLNRRDPAQPLRLPGVLVVLVVFQGLLGMWTVTLLLKPLVVTAHLVGGLTTMSLLWWLALRTDRTTRPSAERGLRKFAILGLAVLAVQIMLGGWVSTNYAALACPDFPTCQRSLWPGMDFRDAFVLWRGLGIDYEGGVLDHPARVAIHFVHRLGAVVAAVVLGLLAWRALRRGQSRAVRTSATCLALLLALQLSVGPTMVLKALPLWLATTHNAIAAMLVLATVALVRFLWTPKGLR
ncbi:MAG: COX15/CtaA family protein [Burkholderiaceae bacterium]|jgi:cytochrome c oxidase assembly protein subunit 15|nr:COX15/CtaA family protein [Burkholderiaceae bacterium]